MTEKRLCQAKTAKGLPCRNPAKEGSVFCAVHSKGQKVGAPAKVPQKAQKKQTMQKIQKKQTMEGLPFKFKFGESAKETLKKHADIMVNLVRFPYFADMDESDHNLFSPPVSMGEAISWVEKHLSEPMDETYFNKVKMSGLEMSFEDAIKSSIKDEGHPPIKGDTYQGYILDAIGFNEDHSLYLHMLDQDY